MKKTRIFLLVILSLVIVGAAAGWWWWQNQNSTVSLEQTWQNLTSPSSNFVVYGCSAPTGTLQTWDGCKALATPVAGEYTAGPCLYDERDGKTYTVRKLSDGQCWLAENLAYGGATTNGDSDGCRKTTLTDTNITRSNRFGQDTYGDCRLPFSSISQADTAHYGYLYTWAAAMQSAQGAEGDNYQPTSIVTGLCPDGWHLPTIDEYKLLGSDANFFSPSGAFSGSYAGYAVPTDTLTYQGARGDYWTTTPESRDTAYYFLHTTTGLVHAEYSDRKNNARAIRCAKPGTPDTTQTTNYARVTTIEQTPIATTSASLNDPQLLTIYQDQWQYYPDNPTTSFGGYSYYTLASDDNTEYALVRTSAGSLPSGDNFELLLTVNTISNYSPELYGGLFKIYTHSGQLYLQVNQTQNPNQYNHSRLYLFGAEGQLQTIVADSFGNYLSFFDSMTLPTDIKYLEFYGGEFGFNGSLYYYLPAENYIGLLLNFNQPGGPQELLGISRNDEIIFATTLPGEYHLIGGIEALSFDPIRKQSSTRVLIEDKNIPYAGYSHPSFYYSEPTYDSATHTVSIDSQGKIYTYDLNSSAMTISDNGQSIKIDDNKFLNALKKEKRQVPKAE